MAEQLADKRDIEFVIWEQFDNAKLLETEQYETFNKKTCDLIITEARKLAIKELLPTLAEGDKEGLHFENGVVKVPECFHRPYQLILEGDWQNLGIPVEMGGQGAPRFLMNATLEYFMSASWALHAYASMGIGSAAMIQQYGTEEQIETYVKKMVSGLWGGTMLLTEPDAGTDVGALQTSARKNPDGTYSITGNKIFITNGEHDLCENIIHPVLARIEGAPSGTRGISIFIVPKYFVNQDGSLGERNDIWCTGVENKHGIKASATCSMSMGAKGDCIGYLLGEENQGLKIMFNMMNSARMLTGLQGQVYASAAYMQAVNYARERIQSRELGEPYGADPVPIIKHPDVRRNLLWMKSYVEGMRSFYHYVDYCGEMGRLAETEEERLINHDMFEFLTPIIKSYLANRSYEVCVQAMQVYAGAGYSKDYLIEQYIRDCKIASIFEGTCGIQAMDLLGRKLSMQEGKVFMHLLAQIQKTVAQAKGKEELTGLAEKVEKMANRLGETAMQLGGNAMVPEKMKVAFAHSLPFLEVTGDTIMAWMWLWRAIVADTKLEGQPKKKDVSFYKGQLKTAKFFIETVVPVSVGKMNSICDMSSAAMEIEEESFGGL